jgi:hypothetical protein
MSLAVVAIGTIAVGAYSAHKASKNAKKANDLAEANMIRQQGVEASKLQTQREELRKMEKQKDVYRSMEFTNPYAENVFDIYWSTRKTKYDVKTAGRTTKTTRRSSYRRKRNE